MEFNEKLQELRKQKGLTQEELAEALYVSRTAISKWESARGYPNIDSLKAISKYFSVSLDELLSGEELITLAETENSYNLKKIYNFIIGILDVMVVTLIFLPLYGNPVDGYIYSVNLLSFTNTTTINLVIYWTVYIIIIVTGITKLISTHFDQKLWGDISTKFSIVLSIIAVCFLAAAREPYATTLLFLFLVGKTYILIKQSKMK
ncbi:MAG: helix-turn-helix domain-containing protein [Lachnospiraceae bacterium]